MGVGGKESKRTVTCRGSFLEIPGKFAGPKTYFFVCHFSFKIKILKFLKFKQ